MIGLSGSMQWYQQLGPDRVVTFREEEERLRIHNLMTDDALASSRI
jgi:hypothetical protein